MTKQNTRFSFEYFVRIQQFCIFAYVSFLHLTTIRLNAEGYRPTVPAYSVGTHFITRTDKLLTVS